MRDFKIQDNLVVEKGRILAICVVMPFDVALLSEDDRRLFYEKIRQAYNMLSTQIQIVAVKDRAKIKDYSSHFDSMSRQTNKSKDSLIHNYINELSVLIESGEVLILKYYFILSVNASTTSAFKYTEGFKKLDEYTKRFTGVLRQAGVETKQLEGKDLIQFFKSQVRQ